VRELSLGLEGVDDDKCAFGCSGKASPPGRREISKTCFAVALLSKIPIQPVREK